jgi:hydroxyethylthiazole kinase-like uncharacterized protein yjeF
VILYNAEQVRQAENNAISSGYSSEQMIQRAGVEVARFIRSRILDCTRFPVIVLCGRGNNGKDGQVAAKTLSSWGFKVSTFQVSDNQSLSFQQKNFLIEDLKRSKVVVDALLGMGQTSDPRGVVEEVLNIAQDLKSSGLLSNPISVSLDVPTGINSDTGAVFSSYFQADHTVCVGCIKPGLLQFPARAICGQLATVDIGLDSFSPSADGIARLYTDCDAKTDLLNLFNRPLNCHKGSFGKVFVFEGVENTTGASILTALSALTIGAPLVFTVGKKNTQKTSNLPPEVMRCFIGDSSKNKFLGLLKKLGSKDCLVVGPGFGLTTDRKKLFWQLLKELSKLKEAPFLVLDADALTILGQASDGEKKFFAKINKSKIVFTPHPKEASVLLKCKTSNIESNRYKAVEDIIKKYKVGAVLLKGASTIVQSNQNNQNSITVHINGKPSLATGGSGDVLAGMIAGLIAQLPFVNAINAAVYVHGKTSVVFNQPVMKASNIIDGIQQVLQTVGSN